MAAVAAVEVVEEVVEAASLSCSSSSSAMVGEPGGGRHLGGIERRVWSG